ncbi:MAG: hypothetical protein CL758_04695 [Chloroflexi bacterium]|nr:hypothetical protein [Chloroflexota bacterium]|tara:strand:+ start:9639 stop:10838 length:1200 start_codon:yes stop_codon:yes gene_type:complete
MIQISYWLLFIPLIMFLVIIHELGHFITAKLSGVKVDEFGIGFPPRIYGKFFKGTIYSINIIPLGGFVKLSGISEREIYGESDFKTKNILIRAIILVSGSVINLLFPILIFVILFMFPRDYVVGQVNISSVVPNSPAELAGLQPGDQIVSIDDEIIDNHIDLVQKVMSKLGSQVELVVRKGSNVSGISMNEEHFSTVNISLLARMNPPKQIVVKEVIDPEKEILIDEVRIYEPGVLLGDEIVQGPLGIVIGTSNVKSVTRQYAFFEAMDKSISKTLGVLITLKNVFFKWFNGGPIPLGGPIGVAQVTGEVAKEGILPLLELIALLSISLGILNLLPIPPLDGGRMAILIVEFINGGRLSVEKEKIIMLIGVIFVIVFFIFYPLYLDISRIIEGKSVFDY